MPTLEQIQAKLKKLQAQADILIARKAQVAIDQIRELMLKHGLTTEDIEARAKARRAGKNLDGYGAAGKVSTSSAGTTTSSTAASTAAKVPKYRDHKTGATWTGHGRAPGWIANAKDRSVFLIDGGRQSKASVKAIATSAKAKGQPKGAQPPKYRHPTSGATWSGRGPAPAWLASVKDRTRFLIDQSSVPASTGAGRKAAGKAGKTNAAGTSGVVSKKAAAKKVVTKKSAAQKTGAGVRSAVVKKSAAKPSVAKPATGASKTAGRKRAAKTVASSVNASANAAVPPTATVQTSA